MYAMFSNINISQGSVATLLLRWDLSIIGEVMDEFYVVFWLMV